MKPLSLTTENRDSCTLVSTLFIDHYMPAASGEYVKVYLLLLRAVQSGQIVSLSDLAEVLDFTGNAVLRALNYWQDENLLSLSVDETGAVTGITLKTPNAKPGPAKEDTLPPAACEGSVPLSVPPKSVAAENIPLSRSFTPEQLSALTSQEDIQQLLFLAEQYLGKQLSATEMTTLLGIYEELDLSHELFEYLMEYCVGKNKRSVRYMEKVAQNWKSEGIRTVEQAKESSSQYQREYYQILSAFGIKGRSPAPAEVTAMSHWIDDLQLPMELILEACRRTILKTSQPSFPYAGSILEDWAKNKLHTMADLVALDQQYHKNQAQKKAEQASQPAAPVKTRFHNFEQRQYDFNEMEKKLFGMKTPKN